MFSLRSSLLPWTCSLVLALVAGCGDSGPKIVPVTGILTHKGKPVTNAYVDFMPENGRPSWGATDEQGHFKLNYDREHDGALVGKHKVSVRLRPTTTAEQEAVMQGKKPPLSKDLTDFFEKYSMEKSKKEVTIDKSTKDVALELD